MLTVSATLPSARQIAVSSAGLHTSGLMTAMPVTGLRLMPASWSFCIHAQSSLSLALRGFCSLETIEASSVEAAVRRASSAASPL